MMYRVQKAYFIGRHFFTDETELMTWEQAVKYFNARRSTRSFWCIVDENGKVVYEG